MKHIVELTARYKMGHSQMTVPVSIIGRNIIRVERIPEEVPDYLDGVLTRVQTTTGEYVAVIQTYDEVIRLWHDSLEHSL